jgi:hypothetical protein
LINVIDVEVRILGLWCYIVYALFLNSAGGM